MDIDPCRAANDAESVTQNVTAITLINKRKPEGSGTIGEKKRKKQTVRFE